MNKQPKIHCTKIFNFIFTFKMLWYVYCQIRSRAKREFYVVLWSWWWLFLQNHCRLTFVRWNIKKKESTGVADRNRVFALLEKILRSFCTFSWALKIFQHKYLSKTSSNIFLSIFFSQICGIWTASLRLIVWWVDPCNCLYSIIRNVYCFIWSCCHHLDDLFVIFS